MNPIRWFSKCYSNVSILLLWILFSQKGNCLDHGDEEHEQAVGSVKSLSFTYATVTKSVVMVTEPDNGTVEYHVWKYYSEYYKDYCVVNISAPALDKVVKEYEDKKMERKAIFFIDIMGKWGNASLHVDDFTAVDPLQESKFKFLPYQVVHLSDIVELDFDTLSTSHIDRTYFKVPLNFTKNCMAFRHEVRLPKKTTGKEKLVVQAYDLFATRVDIFYAALLYVINKGQDFHPEEEREICSVHEFAERPESPFVFLRCCKYGERNLHKRDSRSLSMLCHKPDRGTKFVRNAIIVPAILLLLFAPLAIRLIPRKPMICKKLLKDQDKTSRTKTKTKDGRKYNDAESAFIDRASRRKLLEPNPVENDAVVEVSPTSNEKRDVKDVMAALSEKCQRMIHNRVFLDSSPEYHLSPTLALSYLLLFHKNHCVIILLRRFLFLILCWFFIGLIIFISAMFYTAMLRSNAMKFQIRYLDQILNFFLHEKHLKFNPFMTSDIYPRLYLSLLGLPGALATIQFVLLWFIFLKPRSIASSLLWKDDYKFFGMPIPNIKPVEVQSKHKKSKPSAVLSDEVLLFNTMTKRIKNVGGSTFWKFWWSSVLCVRLSCCEPAKGDSQAVTMFKNATSVLWYIIRFPICIVLVVIYALPVFSVWHNLIFEQKKLFFICRRSAPVTDSKLCRVFLVLLALAGICLTYLMIFDMLVLCGQVIVFVVIDMMRHATETLPRIILFISVVVYIRNAFTKFEDDYRAMKELVIDTCHDVKNDVKGDAEGDVRVVVSEPPQEPLYIEHGDAEVSIPRCVFYGVCDLYMPYAGKLASTLLHLLGTLAVIIILFLAIVEYQILDQFSEVGDTFITIFTVSIPSLFGMFKSASHQSLSERRRNNHITLMVKDMVTTVPAEPSGAEELQSNTEPCSVSPGLHPDSNAADPQTVTGENGAQLDE